MFGFEHIDDEPCFEPKLSSKRMSVLSLPDGGHEFIDTRKGRKCVKCDRFEREAEDLCAVWPGVERTI